MNFKPIVIVWGEPNSVFSEIFVKSIKYKKFKSPIILIMSLDLLIKQTLIFNKKNLNIVEFRDLNKVIDNKKINIINIDHKNNPKIYIKKCFEIAFKILKKGITDKFINGPINKKKFLNNRYLGITEYISKKFNIENIAMLIYNKDLSVSPITTHLPLKSVTKNINKKEIFKKILLIHKFYKTKLKRDPKIAITGLNPHCESIHKFNEDEKIIKPSVKKLKKKKINIKGPFSADTIFLKRNRNKFDVIVGMYHDQVLTPIKTLYEYDAINITLGLPFTRISPDHGPNETMVGMNTSNPTSLIRALEFLDN